MKTFKLVREETLEEKLKSSDPTGKWIHDFVHSDNPKFAGKSKKKRIQMALGAAYAAKRSNEEVEQVKEDRYDDMLDDMLKGKSGQRLLKKHSAEVKKSRDIESGKALQKHVKKNPGVLKTYSNAVKRDKKLYGEEVEQIDEAEMKTKTAYVPYVYTDSHGSGFGGYDVHYSKEAEAHEHVARHGHIDRGGKKGWVEKHEITKHPIHGRWVDANHMRRHGVSEEVDKE